MCCVADREATCRKQASGVYISVLRVPFDSFVWDKAGAPERGISPLVWALTVVEAKPWYEPMV